MHEPASTMSGNDDWRALGACRTEDPELFFPIAASGPGLAQVARAKAVCARCEARAECLRFAMETGQDYGVWGGTSEEERRGRRRVSIRQAGRAAAGQGRSARASQQRQQRGRPARAGRAR